MLWGVCACMWTFALMSRVVLVGAGGARHGVGCGVIYGLSCVVGWTVTMLSSLIRHELLVRL